MKIIGNVNTANKFYIINSNNSIEWVPTLNLAKKYTSNPQYKEWFEKDIYATNEDLVIDDNGKTILKSQYEQQQLEKTLKNSKNIFKQQAKEYLNKKLSEFSEKYNYESFYIMLTWKDSSIKKYKDEAKLALKYRDEAYTYMNNYFQNEMEEYFKNNSVENLDKLYSMYILNFPKF